MSGETPAAWPLDDGLLVEASAGTGKTFTITALYARLVLERGLPVDRILAVTYTEAATRELRGRLRRRLVSLRAAFEHGAPADEFEQAVLASTVDTGLARQRLDRAVSGFDQAAVYTIHGFCQRVLAEAAFESGALFDAEVLTSEAELRQAICDDFWRTVIAREPRAVVEALVDRKVSADSLSSWIGSNTMRDYLAVLPPAARSGEELDTVEPALAGAFFKARNAWRSERERVRDILLDSAALNRNKYRVASVPGWLDAMADLMALRSAPARLFEHFDRFTLPVLEDATKKGHATPDNPFFTRCSALAEVYSRYAAAVDDRIAALKIALREYVRRELAARKTARRWHSFDDLLVLVRDAVTGEGGQRLAAALRERYPAALIDEFQDTDPVQLAIFDAIYGDGPKVRVLVGDPKQAIYSFRGADLFAYLEGRKSAATTRTLDVNYRSDPVLVAAVNRMFENARTPFVFDDLDYPAVDGVAHNTARLLENGAPGQRLRFRYLARDAFGAGDKPIAKERARPAICLDIANEIVRLLDGADKGTITLDGRALNGGDIAVLVRTHDQAREVRDALSAAGVPAVRQGLDNVFHGVEAEALEQVMRAVAEPARADRLRTALVSTLIGRSGTALLAQVEDDAAWDDVVERFRGYHATWRSHGFMPMFRALLVDENVYERILGREGGERHMTNFLHLAELIQARAHEDDASIDVLVKWFYAMRHAQGQDAEEAQLRLESDAERVKIVTMHAAKGLEYPVVFCPFAWDALLRSGDDGEALFHDPANGDRATLDLGSASFAVHRAQARREEFAESIRLFYVAVTRAAQRCYVYHGDIKDAATSPLAWLLHLSRQVDGDPFDEQALQTSYKAMSDEQRIDDLHALCDADPGGVGVEPVAPGEARRTRARARSPGAAASTLSFDRVLARPWRVGSFTALHAGAVVEAPDRDATVHDVMAPEPEEPAAQLSIHRYPRGARTGIAWHEVFEHFDFVDPDDGVLHDVVLRALDRAGIDRAWAPVTKAMVRDALAAELSPDGQMRLQQVERDRRISEMGFFFPVSRLEAPALADMLERHGGDRAKDYATCARRLRFESLHGYLRGFIDLVFEHDGRYYLLDYKSNYLGPDPSHYEAADLHAAMAREGYFLQYLLYVVALHRYLRSRIGDYRYDAHFGGVRYLFLRGMTAGSHRGVYADRPPAALIDALDRYFDEGGTA